MRVLLISTYELGRQPFGLASAASWLRDAECDVYCIDLAVEKLDEEEVRLADLMAFYVPMHTATRIAINLIPRVTDLNPDAHLCFFGLYAPVNEQYLRKRGVGTVLGGEFEEGLVSLSLTGPQRPPCERRASRAARAGDLAGPSAVSDTGARGTSAAAHICKGGPGQRPAAHCRIYRGHPRLSPPVPTLPDSAGLRRPFPRRPVRGSVGGYPAAGHSWRAAHHLR